MNTKILWIVSVTLMIIVWVKVGVMKDSNLKDNEPVSEAPYQDAGEATLDEKNYFKSHPIQVVKPDLAAITDVKLRKQTFFNYLTPFVNEKNALIIEDRKRVDALLNGSGKLSKKDRKWVSTLRKNHKLKTLPTYSKDDLKALLNRLDVIPASLVLAQAANESAWGTSRFATEGNNYFGQWCFRKGCGLVPESRNDDADHEVRKFHDARESVFAYIDNLNTNGAYRSLRADRLQLRESGQEITGLALADGLIHYSQRGQAYIEEIEGLIRYNKLWRFNEPFEITSSNN